LPERNRCGAIANCCRFPRMLRLFHSVKAGRHCFEQRDSATKSGYETFGSKTNHRIQHKVLRPAAWPLPYPWRNILARLSWPFRVQATPVARTPHTPLGLASKRTSSCRATLLTRTSLNVASSEHMSLSLTASSPIAAPRLPGAKRQKAGSTCPRSKSHIALKEKRRLV